MVILLLLTAQRCQFIHTLEVKDISFTEDFVEIQMSSLMKQTRPNFHLGPIRLQQFTQDTDLCIVHCLKTYLDKTKDLRSDGKLFISSQAPHKGVAPGTISRRVKTVLKDSGIDTDTFSAHSTFRKFYNKPIEKSSELQKCLLNILESE